jgi:hypothetical protein
MKSDMADNMLTAAIDQDEAAALDYYDRLSPADRGEIASYAAGREGYEDLRDAPDWVQGALKFFAALALMRTGQSWSQKRGSK